MSAFISADNKLIWKSNHETLQIEPWGIDSLRIRATKNAEITDNDWALIEAAEVKVEINVGDESAEIVNGKIKAAVSNDGRIQFVNAKSDDVFLEEPEIFILIPEGREYKSLKSDLYKITARFLPNDGEKIYGMGQHRHGYLNQKGCVIPLEQRNTEIAIPFALSNKGYGFLWNNPAIGRAEFANNGTKWIAEASRQIDYWITAGDSPAEIIEHYVDATGHAPMLPEFASGFWQCKCRYKTQDELLSVAREHRDRGLPMSVIVIDFFHWTNMGNWCFDESEWPDPSGMVEELDEMGIKVMVSIWPTVNPNSENFKAMKERGLLLQTERGIPVLFDMPDKRQGDYDYQHFYDPTNPESAKFVWEKIRDGYYRHGIKVFWLDACEPEMYPVDFDHVRFHIGNGLEVGCLYPWYAAKAFHDGMKSEGETDVINLCRSTWAGAQRFGAAAWSGDIYSTFESLREQVRAGLNIGLSGIPWWTTDIGGFIGGKNDDPTFRELIVRWFQYGTFCPLFRLHGNREPWEDTSGQPNEVWSFGEDAYGIIKEYLFMRERLRPYIMEQMRVAHENGTPVMRPLFFDFPGDEKAWEVEDQYMFGPDILVAPVLYEGAMKRDVYLPSGTYWRDVWSGERVEGGQVIEVDAPLERIPLYLRGDAQLTILE